MKTDQSSRAVVVKTFLKSNAGSLLFLNVWFFAENNIYDHIFGCFLMLTKHTNTCGTQETKKHVYC